MKRYLPVPALLALVLGGPLAQADYPKPSIEPLSWQLDFAYLNPARIMVKSAGDVAPRAYWYLVYTVTNNTGDEQQFLPDFIMIDEKGKAHRADVKIPVDVFDAIKERERMKELLPIGKAKGRLLCTPESVTAPEDKAKLKRDIGNVEGKTSVAVWSEPLERMGRFSIFISGLSGEVLWYKDGKGVAMNKVDWDKIRKAREDAAGGNPPPADSKWIQDDAKVAGEYMAKTLWIEFHIPGDEVFQGRDRVIHVKESWIMR